MALETSSNPAKCVLGHNVFKSKPEKLQEGELVFLSIFINIYICTTYSFWVADFLPVSCEPVLIRMPNKS